MYAIQTNSSYAKRLTEHNIALAAVEGLNLASHRRFPAVRDIGAEALRTARRTEQAGELICGGHYLAYVGSAGDWKW